MAKRKSDTMTFTVNGDTYSSIEQALDELAKELDEVEAAVMELDIPDSVKSDVSSASDLARAAWRACVKRAGGEWAKVTEATDHALHMIAGSIDCLAEETYSTSERRYLHEVWRLIDEALDIIQIGGIDMNAVNKLFKAQSMLKNPEEYPDSEKLDDLPPILEMLNDVLDRIG